jgi:hypothetical protein
VPHSKPNAEGFKVYRSSIRDCRPCPLRAACFSPNAQRRTVLLNRIILRYCGLGVGILLGPSVNGPSMPPIALVSRVFTEKRKLGMGWPVRCGAVSPT